MSASSRMVATEGGGVNRMHAIRTRSPTDTQIPGSSLGKGWAVKGPGAA